MVLDVERGRNLLVVCAANVCRSPLAEYLLADGLRSIPEFEGHSTFSAGATATDGAAICRRVEARLGVEGADFAIAHRSRRVTPELIARSGLVLTASKTERAAIARLDPSARSRTFTLKEAVVLAEAANGDRVPATDSGAADAPLERFAALVHARRGLVAPPSREPRRGVARFFAPRTDADPLDVLDGHVLGERPHAAALADVSRTVERLLAALSRVAV